MTTRLERLKDLEAKATPGEWTYFGKPILETEKIFCWHNFKGAVRFHFKYKDIRHVQCTKCGRWFKYYGQ